MLKRARPRSVAQQIFVLQTLVMLLVVLAGVGLAYVDARHTQLDSARARSLDVARTVADAPTVLEALRTADPASTIQPFAEAVRVDTGTDFVVVMGLDRNRYSHPDPSQLGKPFIGDLGRAPQGEEFTQEYAGTLGPSMRAVVPVTDGGKVVALVAVGITTEKVADAVRSRLWQIGLAALAVLAAGALGAWLISGRLRRQTHGLGEREITRMYEYYDSVLHAVREGLLLLDNDGVVQLVNDQAVRLLSLPDDAVGRPLADLGLPPTLVASVRDSAAAPDTIHLVDLTVLVVNRADAEWDGRRVGSVITLRDQTELSAVSGELDSIRGLAEALRSQNHEAANRLHAVVSLIELGRPEQAIEFATAELESAQLLTDRVTDAVADPVVAAVLLGKSAQAAERGIDLVVGPRTTLDRTVVEPRDLVTLIGNLLDNAFDAVADSPRKRVEVTVLGDDAGLVIDVADSGPGLPEGSTEKVFERGWSTKRGDEALGRGLGLALVGQVVRRYGGEIVTGRSELGGASFQVSIPGRAR